MSSSDSRDRNDMGLSAALGVAKRHEEPHTPLEKRLIHICTKPARIRGEDEVQWLVSLLRRRSAFQSWKLHEVCRNMGARFVTSGTDVTGLCADSSFSYFMVSGSLIAVPQRPARKIEALFNNDTSSSLFQVGDSNDGSPRRSEIGKSSLGEEETELSGDDHEQHLSASSAPEIGVTIEGASRPLVNAAMNSIPCDVHVNSESVCNLTKCHECSVSAGNSFAARTQRELLSPMGGWKGHEEILIRPGQVLDDYLSQSNSGGQHDTDAEGSEAPPSARAVLPTEALGLSWRLEVCSTGCMGRISHQILEQLQAQEPEQEIEARVDVLKKSELFRRGFGLRVLRRLGALMERCDHRESTRILRKGATVDKVFIVDSGEAIKIGDSRADSTKSTTSLRIKKGQLIGAEEALANLPVYGSNILATKDTICFSIPKAAFLEAVNGVQNQALYHLASRARITSNYVSTDGPSSQVSEQRPFITIMDSRQRFLDESLSSRCISVTSSLHALKHSGTPPVKLSPIPFFSKRAAGEYMRITGTQPDTILAEMTDSKVAMLTPWARESAKDDLSAFSRPRSAPVLIAEACQEQHNGHQPVNENGPETALLLELLPGCDGIDGARLLRSEEDCSMKTKADNQCAASPEFRCLLPVASCPVSLTGCEGAFHPGAGEPMTSSPLSQCVQEKQVAEDQRFSRDGSSRRSQDEGDACLKCRHEDGTLCHLPSFPRGSGPTTTKPARYDSHLPPNLTSCAESTNGTTAAGSLMSTLTLWRDGEVAAARRGVSGRTQRKRICRMFSTRGGSVAGMAAAQRAIRGPYVMSRMRDAKVRTHWRPAGEVTADAVVVLKELQVQQQRSPLGVRRRETEVASMLKTEEFCSCVPKRREP